MALFKTEVTSEDLVSDNPIHQRLLKPYIWVEDKIGAHVAEIGCGDGRGVEMLAPKTKRYLALDKNTAEIKKRVGQMPHLDMVEANIPPLPLPDNSFNTVISFQVIEHILDDTLFLEEIYRILKPGGTAYFTTPNRLLSLSRNPWHIREYTADELLNLGKAVFDEAEMKGITGNEKVMQYYADNKASVEKITRWDFLNLQHRLPADLLKVPYEVMNRLNRTLLKKGNSGLVTGITHEDYLVVDDAENALDLFLIAKKK
jgi:SAM-dependent methyltransferase